MRPNYYEQFNVGKAKYCLNYHDGISTHADGSPFYGIIISRNKKAHQAEIKRLIALGYYERGFWE